MGDEDKRHMYFELTPSGKNILESIKNNSNNILEFIEKIRLI